MNSTANTTPTASTPHTTTTTTKENIENQVIVMKETICNYIKQTHIDATQKQELLLFIYELPRLNLQLLDIKPKPSRPARKPKEPATKTDVVGTGANRDCPEHTNAIRGGGVVGTGDVAVPVVDIKNNTTPTTTTPTTNTPQQLGFATPQKPTPTTEGGVVPLAPKKKCARKRKPAVKKQQQPVITAPMNASADTTNPTSTPPTIAPIVVPTAPTKKVKLEIFVQNIHGIVYYVDKFNNVFNTEDIIARKECPAIIAKYEKTDDDVYSIPEFGFV